MIHKFKILLFAALVLCSAVAVAQDAIMQGINNALASGNCEKAAKLYKAWKDANEKTNSQVESLIQKCKNGSSNSSTLPPSTGTSTNQTFTAGGVGFTMVYVQGGTFTMGCTGEQGSDCESEEKPAHSVTLSSYHIGRHEVTQALWQAVMGSNPSGFKGDNLPVENVSWEDCRDFIRNLNAKTGQNFRLPTEAEWEFAARGGNRSDGVKYSGAYSMDNAGWYSGNSNNRTHAVGTKNANELGIYDMSGNVLEWCSDWYGSYSSNSQTNPQGASSGSLRVYRGGSWSESAQYCRVSNRYVCTPGDRGNYLGFRLALSK